ncbi:hypothetical protein KFL_004410080 [Klebsormidium nitens]|uniref:DUF676 domain-containing protein n=1 Tax=Klebsormidium nitens TaxID=105231 RepID=A0A1Y1ICD8_KLENI|nr:hypothetical protein KFL_004410080 [Klebsormidium nitens]|eukprot:GAQ88580.1 hypothetical protein KFL_004410080 [Klebsormidium nitens]
MVCTGAARGTPSAPCPSTSDPEHLIVLANGILSDPNDWNHLESLLLKEPQQSFLLYAEKDNVSFNTMRGIDVAGKRLAEGVLEVVKRTPSLRRISFVAHSLGGLFVRYCLALLYRPGKEGSAHVLLKGGATRVDSNSGGTPCQKQRGGEDGEAEKGSNRATRVEMVQDSQKGVPDGTLEAESGLGVDGGQQDGATWRSTEEDSLPSYNTHQPVTVTNSQTPVGVGLDPSESNLLGHFASEPGSDDPKPQPTIAGLEPAHLILVAVPHLGVWGRRQWPFAHGVHSFERVASCFSGVFLGRTLKQLFLRDRNVDGEPLLLSMSKDCKDRPFVSALGAFRTRHLYANVRYDAALGWKTSCIRYDTDLDQVQKRCLERAERREWLSARYPHIVHVEETPGLRHTSETSSFQGAALDYVFAPPLTRQLSEALTAALSKKGKDGKGVASGEGKKPAHRWSSEEACRALEDRMVGGLHRVSWTKVDVLFHRAPGRKYAHQMLILKDPVQQAAGQGVVNHIIDVLCDNI